ncbi:acyl-CoA dehydrogenase [Rhodobacterales bacterium HKCCE3408]|nr:acyl-CoA dehydrogenase [Rhodobacterales bacterium HKCCE3408]
MNFEMSDDRRMLADSLGRLLDDACGFEHRTKVAYEAPWHDPAMWSGLAELGLFHAFLSEDQGGFGGAGFDITCVFEPLGRALCPEPVLAQMMGLTLLATAGAETGPALDGTERLALAVDEPDAPWEPEAGSTEFRGGKVTGRKSVVYGGHVADRFLVAALADGKTALVSVAAGDASVTPYGMIDGGGASEVVFEEAPGEVLIADAGAAIADALDRGRLALAAEAVGAMDAALALFTDYLKTRKQFGRPIGTFQALQHRAVDLAIETEQARSIVIRAAAAMGTEAQGKAVAQAKALTGKIARLVAEETIQMQGGVAMTWEYPSSHYAKRLTMIDHQLGDAMFHTERLAKMV